MCLCFVEVSEMIWFTWVCRRILVFGVSCESILSRELFLGWVYANYNVSFYIVSIF